MIKLRLDRTQAMRAAVALVADGKRVEQQYRRVGAAGKQSAKEVADATKAAEKDKQDAIAKTVKAQASFVDAADRARGANGQFVAGMKTTAATAVSTGKASAGAIGSVRTAINGVTASLGGLTTGILTINAVTSASKAMLGVFEAANEQAQSQVDKLLATKNLVREIAAITGGKEGSSDAQVNKFLAIRSASGLNDQSAQNFALEYAGSGEAKKGINISEAEYEKAKPLMARFAAANSQGDAGAAGTYGRMAGMLMGFGKDITADKLLAQQTQFNKILSLGVGDNPTLIREAASKAGAVLDANGTGMVKTPNDLAALVSTASMVNPKFADTMITQALRVTRGFTDKHAPMLEAADITPDDDLPGAMTKLFGQIDNAAKAGVKPDVYLAGQGVENIEDRNTVQAFYNNRQYLDRFRKEGAVPMDPNVAKAQLEGQFRADVGLQTNVGEAKLEEAKLQSAMPYQHLKPLELEAKRRLQLRGEGEDSGHAAFWDWVAGTASTGIVGSMFMPMGRQELGRKMREDEEMAKILKEKGVDVPGRPHSTSPLGGWSGDFTSYVVSGANREAMAEAASTAYLKDQVGGGAKPASEAMAEAQRRTNQLLEEQNALLRQQQGNPNRVAPRPPAPLPGPLRGSPPVPVR